MDRLSSAASGIAVVSLAVQLADSVKKLCDFWNSIKEAPEDIREIAMDLDILSSVLAQIAIDAQRIGPDTTFKNALNRCSVQVTKLYAVLKEIEPGFSSANLRVRKWTAFKAVMKSDSLTKFQNTLNSLKATLLLVQQNIYSRSTQNQYISLEQNLVVITQTLSELKMQQQLRTAKNFETLALKAPPDQIESSPDEWIATNFDAKNGPNENSSSFSSDEYQGERSFVRRSTQKDDSIINSFLGTFRAVSTTKLRKLKEAGDGTRFYTQDEYEYETVYTIHPAPWMIRLGIRYGLNARLSSTSTLGFQKLMTNAFRLVPDDALIFELCREGNLPAVGSLFARGIASARDTDSWGQTPLHVAAYNHHLELCRFLKGASADEHAHTHDGVVPIDEIVHLLFQKPPSAVEKAFETARLLSNSLDFSEESGNGWRWIDTLCAFPAFAALRLRMIRLLSFELKVHLDRDFFISMLLLTLYSNRSVGDTFELLLNLAGPKLMQTSQETSGYPILHMTVIYDRTGNGLSKLLERGLDLHQLAFDDEFTPQKESPTSLAMYSSWGFVIWLRELYAIEVDLVAFLREELQRNYMVHPGWSEQSLIQLFMLGGDAIFRDDAVWEVDFQEWDTFESRCCSDCGHLNIGVLIQPSWRHLLEKIKKRVEPNTSAYAKSEEENNDKRADVRSDVGATGSEIDQAHCHESSAKLCADNLNEHASSLELKSPSISQPSVEIDIHNYPANVSLESDCLYEKNEILCPKCWHHYIRTGSRSPREPRVDRRKENTAIRDKAASSEGDFSPYHVHS